MAVIVSTGGSATVAIAAVADKIAALAAAGVTEGAVAAAVAADAAGAAVAAETALSVAIAAETAATTVVATNVWNPVGWAIGAVLVGASQHDPQAVTWGCYKPIGEVDNKELSTEPITFADLAAHPEIQRAVIYANTVSANLPEVEIENKARQLYLLQGVILPCGSAAYHAERIDK